MWKWKRQIFVKAEAIKGYRYRFGHLYKTLKTYMWCFFENIWQKVMIQATSKEKKPF